MAARQVPEPWLTAMLEANLGDPRNGQPSFNALARKAGIASSTLWRIVDRQIKDVRVDTIENLAEALNKKPDIVARWVGQAWENVSDEYVPPREANLLTLRQRKAVDELIKSMTEDRRRAQLEAEQLEKATALKSRSQGSGSTKSRARKV